ncbi:MAG TPA: hypothetical protein VN253_14230 [Kofleriaceae bacterium]|nr:hypothetical protein [Kofleriaceae bacterium]
MKSFKTGVALFLLCGFVTTASAGSATVYATQDAMIFATSGGADTGNASGKGPGMFAGADGQSNKKRTLITFDLASASIPSNAIIDSVTMTLVVGQVAGYGGSGCPSGCTYTSRTIRVYHLTTAWNEGSSGSPTSSSMSGTGQGWTIGSGDTSWTYTNYSGSQWTTLGGDFNATEIASSTFGPTFPLGMTCTWSSAGMVTDVQNWLSTPSSYKGWLIKSDLETSGTSFLGWWTKDGATANNNNALRPKLDITWH